MSLFAPTAPFSMALFFPASNLSRSQTQHNDKLVFQNFPWPLFLCLPLPLQHRSRQALRKDLLPFFPECLQKNKYVSSLRLPDGGVSYEDNVPKSSHCRADSHPNTKVVSLTHLKIKSFCCLSIPEMLLVPADMQ